MADTLTIRPANTAADHVAVRQLCWDYRADLMTRGPGSALISDIFYGEETYRVLLDRLPSIHARPKGIILLACLDNEIVGCGMTYQQAPGASEIKRVFVSDTARGMGAGRTLCLALIDQARADGYNYVRLDTSHELAPAIRLYESLGFQRRDAFYDVPPRAVPLVRFYEMPL